MESKQSHAFTAMSPNDALMVLSAYSPCRHESYESLGVGNVWGKCCDCGVRFELASIPRRALAADRFDDAVDTLARAFKSGPS